MLKIKKTAIIFGANDLLDLEIIVTDADEKEALRFLKRAVYDRITLSQRGGCQCEWCKS